MIKEGVFMKKTGRVYKRMIITYVLVLCIPILLSAVLYQFTYRTVCEQSLENNSNLLNRVSNSCDRDISYYRNVLIQLNIGTVLDDDAHLIVDGQVILVGLNLLGGNRNFQGRNGQVAVDFHRHASQGLPYQGSYECGQRARSCAHLST